MANENEPLPVNDKPVVANKPSFLNDVLNGFYGTLASIGMSVGTSLVHIAKTIWQVPAAQGAIATLVVRAGLPATVVAVLIPVIDALVK